MRLNQVSAGSLENFRILGCANEEIGLHQYKQVSEFQAKFEFEHPVVNP